VSPSFAQNNLTEIENFGQNPGNLRMFIYNKIQTQKSAVPLIIALHGCNQDANDFAELSGWNKIAENQQFLILYPQQKRTNNISNCFNWFNSLDIDNKNGECFSIFEMINYMKTHFLIDTTQIFITGVSAGGAMSVALLANFPSQFNAGAIIAGGAYGLARNVADGIKVMNGNKRHSNTELKNFVTNLHTNDSAITYPTIYLFQGKNDKIVNPRNADYLKTQWCGVHDIDTIADNISVNQQDTSITIYQYQNSLQQSKVIVYLVEKLGHKLLINPGPDPNKGGKLGVYGQKSNFHSTYQIAIDFKLIH
jgi:poly(hydroxyalkanoate) depolymerase family esterase